MRTTHKEKKEAWWCAVFVRLLRSYRSALKGEVREDVLFAGGREGGRETRKERAPTPSSSSLTRSLPHSPTHSPRVPSELLLPCLVSLALLVHLSLLPHSGALFFERPLVLLLGLADAGDVEAVLLEVHLLLGPEGALTAAAGGALVVLRQVVEVVPAVDVPAVSAHHGHSKGLFDVGVTASSFLGGRRGGWSGEGEYIVILQGRVVLYEMKLLRARAFLSLN